jgi:hypothetical protein
MYHVFSRGLWVTKANWRKRKRHFTGYRIDFEGVCQAGQELFNDVVHTEENMSKRFSARFPWFYAYQWLSGTDVVRRSFGVWGSPVPGEYRNNFRKYAWTYLYFIMSSCITAKCLSISNNGDTEPVTFSTQDLVRILFDSLPTDVTVCKERDVVWRSMEYSKSVGLQAQRTPLRNKRVCECEGDILWYDVETALKANESDEIYEALSYLGLWCCNDFVAVRHASACIIGSRDPLIVNH